MKTRTIRPESQAVVDALVALFTGPDVVHHSMMLALSGDARDRADRYFAARDALGLCGYPNKADAEVEIRIALAL